LIPAFQHHDKRGRAMTLLLQSIGLFSTDWLATPDITFTISQQQTEAQCCREGMWLLSNATTTPIPLINVLSLFSSCTTTAHLEDSMEKLDHLLVPRCFAGTVANLTT
jgi:hypothetical protein